MAEQEVIKHTKKIYRIWNNKQHSVWDKVKEFLIEIFIIVFAVSLSMWLHNRSEHSHQQEDVKSFLVGLRSDLQSDLTEMSLDRASIVRQSKAFTYLVNVPFGQKVNPDSLERHQRAILSATGLQPNSGRFEGFKSSGKIGTIEDKDLQNDIMDLYQENIPSLILSTNYYKSRKERLYDLIQVQYKRNSDSTNNMVDIMSSQEAYAISSMLSDTDEITNKYDSTVAKMKLIIGKIDGKYGK